MVEKKVEEEGFLAVRTAKELVKKWKEAEEEKHGKQQAARVFLEDLRQIKEEMVSSEAEFYFRDRPEVLKIDSAGRVLLVRTGDSEVEMKSGKDFELLLELAATEIIDIR